MSRTRWWMSKHPGRISVNRVGSTPYSSGGRPATALSPTLVASWPSNTQASVPSSLVTTRGARSRQRAARWPANMSGGSTTWSSTETRMRSSVSMGCSSRTGGSGELAAQLEEVGGGRAEEGAPAEQAAEVAQGPLGLGAVAAVEDPDGGVADHGQLAGEGLDPDGGEVVGLGVVAVGGPQGVGHRGAGVL